MAPSYIKNTRFPNLRGAGIFLCFHTALYVFVFPFRIHRKPSFKYPFPLFEDFQNAPEWRASRHAEYGRDKRTGRQQRTDEENATGGGKCPPATGAEIIFRLDDNGVEQTDYEECRYGNNEAEQIMGWDEIHEYSVIWYGAVLQ